MKHKLGHLTVSLHDRGLSTFQGVGLEGSTVHCKRYWNGVEYKIILKENYTLTTST